MQYLALHHWSKFQKNPTSFGGVMDKKLSTATKTFEILKLGNHKCYTDESYHNYAPP